MWNGSGIYWGRERSFSVGYATSNDDYLLYYREIYSVSFIFTKIFEYEPVIDE
jgi:hypothetical protein